MPGSHLPRHQRCGSCHALDRFGGSATGIDIGIAEDPVGQGWHSGVCGGSRGVSLPSRAGTDIRANTHMHKHAYTQVHIHTPQVQELLMLRTVCHDCERRPNIKVRPSAKPPRRRVWRSSGGRAPPSPPAPPPPRNCCPARPT